MRKMIFYTVLFMAGITVQFGFNQYIAVKGLAPNFILLLLIYLSLIRGAFAGQVLGFAWGLSWDIMSIDLFGSHTLVFTCIGYMVGNLSKKWDEDKTNSRLVLTFTVTLFFWLAMYLLYELFGPVKLKANMYLIAAETVLNTALAPLVFSFLKSIIGYLDVFDENN